MILTSCADSPDLIQAVNMDKVGFWHGLWHGIISPIAFVVSLFSENTAIYAIYNNGIWYDFGFILGIGGFTRSVSNNK